MLESLAARLIWWQSPERSLREPDRVIAHVMDLGNFGSVLPLKQALGDGLAAATALYGPAFPPEEALKALVGFADGVLEANTFAAPHQTCPWPRCAQRQPPSLLNRFSGWPSPSAATWATAAPPWSRP